MKLIPPPSGSNGILGFDPKELKGQTILDLGCGPGRFIDVAVHAGARVIGIDYSSAVEAAADNFKNNPNVLIVQGNALELPIQENSLDGAFSIGVLHHTPDPFRGFSQMIRTLKARAWVAACVYGKGGYYDSPRVSVWRNLFSLLRPVFGNLPPLAYSYFAALIVYPLSFVPGLGHALRAVFPSVRLPDWKWRLLDTYDSVTPSYQSAHESFEVFQWFKKMGLVEIEPSDWGFSSFHGRKPESARFEATFVDGKQELKNSREKSFWL